MELSRESMACEASGSYHAAAVSFYPPEGCRMEWSGIVRQYSPGSLGDLPGARESNAGDEFHLLWGVSLCLGMIQPDSPLQSVVIENVDPLDQTGSPQRAFLAADITEYYGGSHFEKATEVVVSQLKYSHRRPNESWTAGRLAPKGEPREKTILGKFVDTYNQFRSRSGREAVLDRLKIRLISNQPCGPTLLRMVKSAQSLLASSADATSNRTIVQSLDGHARRAYDLLFRRSGLGEEEFTDFIRVLDIDYLGSADRFEQQRRIVITLGKHVLGDVFAAQRSLYELVRKKALPEASRYPGIVQADVLAHLGVTGSSDLFPLPARVEIPDFVVRQPDAERLAQTITSTSTQHIVAHGDAGVGKTVSLIELQETMPGDSVVVLYDCFAGGEYLGPTERRHDPRYAIRQLVNEIALKCGTPLLLPGAADDLALWQKLEQVLSAAAGSLEEDEHLVLAIDAADNAVIASRERQGESCFVPDLWRLPLPENVHVVMTCRSARADLLAAADSAHEIELTGFDQASSTEHLRHHFSDATDDECQRFHDNSSGNPRVQAYVLDPQRVDRPTTATGCANEAATTLGDRFEDLVQTAIHSRMDACESREWLAVLMALERPIRLESLVMASGAAEEEVYRFCRGLVPGVRIEEATIVFRDEDFEAYIREQYLDEERTAAHSRIADCYMTLKDSKYWAAQAVAGHLFNAGRADELITLTLDDREPSAITDPLARSQTHLGRVSLALRMTAAADRSDSIKLIVLAAAVRHADTALAALVGDNPELAMRYADPVAVAHIYEAKRGEAWKGPLHMRVAASMARLGDLETARTRLRMAGAWLRRWSDLDDEGRQRWRLKADDLSAWAEAIFYVAGPEATGQAVRSWHPERYALRIAEHLVERLAQRPSQKDLALWIEQQDLPTESESRLLAALFRNGGSASPSQLQRVCRQLIACAPSYLYGRDETWPLELIEQAASVIDDTDLLDLIKVLRPSFPDYAPDYGLGDWETVLRFTCLEEVIANTEFDAEDLLPSRLRESAIRGTNSTQRQVGRLDGERTKLLRVLKEALPLYRLRASAVAGRVQPDDVVAQSLRLLEPFTAHRYYRNDRPHRFNQTANAVFDSLCLTDANPQELCDVLLAVTLDDKVPLATWLEVAELLLRRGAHARWGLRLIDRVVQETQVRDEPIREKTERLIKCATLVDPIDETLASDYFSEAIKASSGLDEERSRVLGLVNHLANSLPESDQQGGSVLAPRLRQAVEHFRPFVFDPDRLPWTETLATVTRLSPNEGVRTLTLWDESGDLHIQHGVTSVATALVARRAVDVAEAVHLLWLTNESMGCAQPALGILERTLQSGASRRELTAAVAWLGERITRHLTVGARLADARVLASWTKTNGFEHVPWASDVSAIKTMADGSSATDGQTRKRSFRDDESARSRRDRIAGLLANAASDGLEDLADRLEQLAKAWASSSQIGHYLSLFGTSISPDMRIQALDAVSKLPPDTSAWRRSSYAIARGLAEWTSIWAMTNSVHNWANQHLPEFFLQRFPTIVGHGYLDQSALSTYLSISAIDDPAGLMLEATSRHLQDLDPEQLIFIARTLSDHLPEQDRLDDLTWILDDLLGTSETPKGRPTAATGELLLAETAWALLGHPDKFVRWRAAHFVLDRSRMSGTFAHNLMRHFDDQTGLGYYAPTSDFLWMSAQVWVLIALRRLAVDNPESVSRFAPRLSRIATNREWPHALLREIARSTLSELPSDPTVPSAAHHSTLAFVNQPTACKTSRRNLVPQDRERDEDVGFRFNQMDTVPYWFAPLGRVFGIATSEVESQAERWVVDELGYDETTVRVDRPTLRDRYRYQDIYNDHGSQPRVENLRTYLEWHAMFLVAGALVDSDTPIVVPNYESPDDPWSRWLTGFLDLTGRLWISDQREPVPPRRHLHVLDPSRETWRDVSSADFDREVLDGDTLVVSASIDRSHGSLYEHLFLDSALLTPESARSLVSCLQNAPNPYSNPLPTDDDQHGVEINEPGFQLLGWLTDLDHEGGRLEEHDPLRRIRFRTVVPGQAFRNLIASTYSANEWQTSTHTLPGPVTVLRWSDEPADRRTPARPRYTAGRQTLVCIPELLTFLSNVGKDLIIKVVVSRHFAHEVRLSDNEEEERYDPGTARIYLLRRDGTLYDGLGRRIDIGEGNRLTTQH